MRTQVGIVGAGPAGLLAALMLQRRGIASVILEQRERAVIEATIRAGILEQSTVELMIQLGVADRLLREAVVHDGITLRFNGRNHPIDFTNLTDGRMATLYPQHEVLKDLIAAALQRGCDIRFGCAVIGLESVETTPIVKFRSPEGRVDTLACDIVVGADGSHGVCHAAIPAPMRTDYVRAYPFGWFGILCEAPRSSDRLVYTRHERGFALISSRSATVQRMYFQCDPMERTDAWSDDRIWAELQARVAGEDGFRLNEGPIRQKTVVPMRSAVCEPMQFGRLLLAGDAAHVVPPTGAKGLNLAASDVWHLDRALGDFFESGATAALPGYSAAALRRVWQAQHFSWSMTAMLHRFAEASAFDERRQLAELAFVTGHPAAAKALAQTYVGEPFT